MATVEAIAGYCVDKTCACHTGAEVEDRYLRIDFDDGLPVGCCKRCGRHGPQPATVVLTSEGIAVSELERRILETRAKHGAVLQAYHEIWYNASFTWPFTHFLGVGLMKAPNDLWAYQALMTGFRPRTVIETGTYQGGSALWFAYLQDMLGIDDGRVFTIDLDDHRDKRAQHPRVVFLGGDSTDPALAHAVISEVKYPLLVVLDADHACEHVRKELELYAPACRVNDWIVTEDTNVQWLGPDGDRGAAGGVEDYLHAHPGEFRQDILLERWLLTMAPGGWLERVAECPHGR